MKKKNIVKKKNRVFFISLLTSIAFPCGIVATVLGAINELVLVMVLGLVFLVVSFFALPFTWIAFASLVTKSKIVQKITKEKITDINTLASIFNKQPQEVENVINDLIAKGYLDYTLLYDKVEEKPLTERKAKCPNCGAVLINKKDKLICEYCNSEYHS